MPFHHPRYNDKANSQKKKNCKECHVAIKVVFGEHIDNTHSCNLIRECLSNRYRKQSFPFLRQPDDYTSPWGNHSNHNSHISNIRTIK